MKRKHKVQQAIRYFRGMYDTGDTLVRQGLTLAQEIRRLRLELRKTNKVVQRYSRALGLIEQSRGPVLPVPVPEVAESLALKNLQARNKWQSEKIAELRQALRERSAEIALRDGPESERANLICWWRRVPNYETGKTYFTTDCGDRQMAPESQCPRCGKQVGMRTEK